jgi:glycosyltransferase involved in cell wall biosynthesis
VVPYFMDDWMANNPLRWRGGSLQQVVKDVLAAAPAWLMISEALKNTLIKRYQLATKPCLVVHNPSPSVALPSTNQPIAERPQPTARRLLVYAGSIWPMHADALVAVAQAIQLLHAQGSGHFVLHIYTTEGHWRHYAGQLQGPGVQFMGWKPYARLPPVLAEGWLLLCTASFAETFLPFSLSSVQTKLTDYMAAGTPLLYVGPSAGASGQFVETWDCGFTLGSPNPADVAEGLQAIARMPTQYSRKAHNALSAATTTFSKATVQRRLYDFLARALTCNGAAPANPVAR